MSYPYQIKDLTTYERDYKRSVQDPEGFWGDVASHFLWKGQWDQVLDWDFNKPEINWFKGD